MDSFPEEVLTSWDLSSQYMCGGIQRGQGSQ